MLSPSSPQLTLDSARDYIVTIPLGATFSRPVTISGGRNVVLENATLRYVPPVGAALNWSVRGLLLTNQTGVMWVKGFQLRGPLAEGIDLSQRQPRSVVVLRDITIDLVTGSYSTNHADLLQTWAGPDRLVVDGFTGSSTYQGMMLKPNDLWPDGPRPTFFSLRNVSLDISTGRYALWTVGHDAFPLEVRGVDVRPNPERPGRDQWLWPKPSTGDLTWQDVVAD